MSLHINKEAFFHLLRFASKSLHGLFNVLLPFIFSFSENNLWQSFFYYSSTPVYQIGKA
jgi:hypothetical protein